VSISPSRCSAECEYQHDVTNGRRENDCRAEQEIERDEPTAKRQTDQREEGIGHSKLAGSGRTPDDGRENGQELVGKQCPEHHSSQRAYLVLRKQRRIVARAGPRAPWAEAGRRLCLHGT
jgi:hypothetical protein